MVGNSQVRTNKHDSLSHLILSNCQSRACLVSQQLTSVAVLAMQACRQDCLRGMSSCCARALGAEAQPRVLTTSLQRKTVLIGKLEKAWGSSLFLKAYKPTRKSALIDLAFFF